VSTRLRNLDIATLRSFVTIAETGSMTRSATRLFLTQSAISMQIKRLEMSLDMVLFERSSGGMLLTSAGEQLLQYAKQMLNLNDEVIGRLTAPEFEGEIRLGVPDDIIFPRLPDILKQFARDYPRVKVKLTVDQSKALRKQYEKGQQDLILTTEFKVGDGGEVISKQRAVWTGAEAGNAWKERPLPVAITRNCAFRTNVTQALDKAEYSWQEVANPDNVAVVEALTSADFCVTAELEQTIIVGREVIDHKGALPELPVYKIIVYAPSEAADKLSYEMAGYLRTGYA